MGGANLSPWGDDKGIQDSQRDALAKRAAKKAAQAQGSTPPPPVDEVAPLLREISRARTQQELNKRSGRYGSFFGGMAR